MNHRREMHRDLTSWLERAFPGVDKVDACEVAEDVVLELSLRFGDQTSESWEAKMYELARIKYARLLVEDGREPVRAELPANVPLDFILGLTDGECALVKSLIDGLDVKQTAGELGLRPSRVDRMRRRIAHKWRRFERFGTTGIGGIEGVEADLA